jgi:beta-glucosidase
VGQLPDFYNFDPSRTHKYVDDDGAPLFPFGFGLSYTTFRYDHIAVQTPSPGSNGDIVVTVDVTNDGDRPGEEVPQLYVRQDVGSVETPDRSLKGFSRIVLNPRETKNVTFRIPQGQLAVWDVQSKWTVEAGPYTVWVGGSSQASLTTKFVIHR